MAAGCISSGTCGYLFIFGDNVEDRMGSLPYLLFYLICGIVSGLTQAFIAPTSQVPAIGASGAIAGVLAAYMIFFPRARVVTLCPLVHHRLVYQYPCPGFCCHLVPDPVL